MRVVVLGRGKACVSDNANIIDIAITFLSDRMRVNVHDGEHAHDTGDSPVHSL